MDFYLFFFLFVFHKEFLVISHNFNDQVYTIIIAQPNLDNQIGAIERVDINPQPLKTSLGSQNGHKLLLGQKSSPIVMKMSQADRLDFMKRRYFNLLIQKLGPLL